MRFYVFKTERRQPHLPRQLLKVNSIGHGGRTTRRPFGPVPNQPKRRPSTGEATTTTTRWRRTRPRKRHRQRSPFRGMRGMGEGGQRTRFGRTPAGRLARALHLRQGLSPMHGRRTMSGCHAKIRFMPRQVGILPLGCLSPTGQAQSFKRPIAGNFELEAAWEREYVNVCLLPARR